MFCPTCGLEHAEVRRFCNRCGTNLAAVARTLAGSPPDPGVLEQLEKRRQAMRRAIMMICTGPVISIFLLMVAEVMRGAMGTVPHPTYGYLTDPGIVLVVENMGLFGVLVMFIGFLMMVHTRLTYGRKKDLVSAAQSVTETGPRPGLPVPAVTANAVMPPSSVTETSTIRLGDNEGINWGESMRQTKEQSPEHPRITRDRT